MPFLLAVYDCWDIQDTRPSKETAGASWPSKFIRGRARYLLPAAILSGASILSSYHANALRSTYICPHFASAQRIVPALQTLAALLDCYVLVSIDRAIRRRITNGVLSGNTASIVLGSTFLVCIHNLARFFSALTLQSSLLRFSLLVGLLLLLHTQHTGNGFSVLIRYISSTWLGIPSSA